MTTLGEGIAVLMHDAAINRAFARQEREACENANEWSRAYDRVEQQRARLHRQLAGYLSLYGATFRSLRTVHPTHPTLFDKQLKERIVAAGEASGQANPDDFQAMFRVGERFEMPQGVRELDERTKDLEGQVKAQGREIARLGREALAVHERWRSVHNESVARGERVATLESELAGARSVETPLHASLAASESQVDRLLEQLWGQWEDTAGQMALQHAYRTALREVRPDHPLLLDATADRRIESAAHDRFSQEDKSKGVDWSFAREIGESWAGYTVHSEFETAAPTTSP